jgi:protein TonB
MIAGHNKQPLVISFRGEPLHLDRSLALALVAIGHLAFALWMLLPVSMAPDPQAPQAPVDPPERIPAVFIKAKVTPLPPPPPDVTVPQRQTPVKTLPVAQHPIVEAPPDAAWVEPMPSAPSSTDYIGESIAPAAPAESGVPLAYESASPPRYPRDAARLGQEGTVLLRVQVDASGNVLRVDIEQGSGVRALDDEAQRHVKRHWRFHPAMHEGRAVAAWALVPISFSLQ